MFGILNCRDRVKAFESLSRFYLTSIWLSVEFGTHRACIVESAMPVTIDTSTIPLGDTRGIQLQRTVIIKTGVPKDATNPIWVRRGRDSNSRVLYGGSLLRAFPFRTRGLTGPRNRPLCHLSEVKMDALHRASIFVPKIAVWQSWCWKLTPVYSACQET